MKNEKLQKIVKNSEVFLLDMDGTVYLGDKLIGNMSETLKKLRTTGKRLVFLTNNSSKTATEYKEKLVRLGLWDERDTVYTSAMATTEYLLKEHSGKRVFLLATEPVKRDFIESGINLVEEKPEVCVLAYDTSLTFEKIRKFNEFLVEGAYYVVTHPDLVCPADGVSWPDLGSFIKLFETSAKRLPDIICGKPYTVMGECVSAMLNMSKDKLVMVGDRLNTDIRFGLNCGFNTIVVLSGETTASMANVTSDKPDVVLTSLNDIVEYL